MLNFFWWNPYGFFPTKKPNKPNITAFQHRLYLFTYTRPRSESIITAARSMLLFTQVSVKTWPPEGFAPRENPGKSHHAAISPKTIFRPQMKNGYLPKRGEELRFIGSSSKFIGRGKPAKLACCLLGWVSGI